jgi:rhodanese-related sulfurtransferase
VNGRGQVIGVLTFVSLAPGPEGAIVQGFNFIVPADAVREFVGETGVKWGAGGGFNAAWWAGLREFFDGAFVAAERRFQEATKLHANLPDVKRMMAEAQEKIKNPPPRPFPWAWVALGVSVASGSGFGGLWARRWWRNRFRISPAQVIKLMEAAQKPVFLDVREASDYEASPLKLPGALRVAPEEVEGVRLDLTVEPNQVLVTYCASPNEQTSARVVPQLRRRGYRNVRILKGGLGGWTNAGLPVEAKAHLPSIGVELYKHLAARQLQARHFAAGQVVFAEGDDAKGEAYIVHAGRVAIRKRVDGGEQVLRELAEGELLGELALIREMPRSASAVAATDVDLLVIGRQQLEWLIRNRPELTLEIMKRMSGWLAGAGAGKPPEPPSGAPPPRPGA